MGAAEGPARRVLAPWVLAAALVVICAGGSRPWAVLRAVVIVGAAVGLARLARGGRRPPALLAIGLAGLLGLGAGSGIAVPHLAKGGPAVLGLAGVAAALAGLGLLGRAAGAALRATPGWWRLAVAPSLLVVVVVVTSTVGLAVAATNVPRPSLGSTTPADLGLAAREVELRTADGVRLAAWYVPSTNGAAVVVLHGAGSTRASVLPHAAVLARHGYGVLLLDARGHGTSGGRAMDLGWWGDADVAAAVTFLAARTDVDDGRIGVVGLSMGGEEALGAAAADDRIGAVVAEGATGRVAGDDAWLSDAHGWRGAVQEVVDAAREQLVDLLTDARPPATLRTAAREAAPTPVLLVAAGTVADEQQAARFIAAASPGTVQVWVVPGAGHTDGLATRGAEWERRVTAFLASALLR